MIEFSVIVAMTAGSVLLFGYWFRYTCVLILSTKTVRDYAGQVAAANQLEFLEVQERLKSGATNLGQLQGALDRDYSILVSLLSAVSSGDAQGSIETRMLQLNYRCMAAWSSFSRRFSSQASSRAMEEMAQVLSHFANLMGEHATSARVFA